MCKVDSFNLSRFYVCKHCRRKIHISYIAKHTVANHIDKNYWIVEYESQTTFEIQNNELTGKVELTEDEANRKYGFKI